ncbi:MAG: dihydroneopterin aldolase [Phaeodactylibacter sp.]|nr:dihydroneopterin aldolase [Phaeodactylibacter sp.]
MATIALEGMRFFAYHGYYEEEQILGNEFVVDIFVNTETILTKFTDDLHADLDQVEELLKAGEMSLKAIGVKRGKPDDDKHRPTTVNYETLYLLCQKEMREPAHLLETVVDKIADSITDYFDNVEGVLVRLKKLNPPLGGRVASAWVMASRGEIEIPMFGGES